MKNQILVIVIISVICGVFITGYVSKSVQYKKLYSSKNNDTITTVVYVGDTVVKEIEKKVLVPYKVVKIDTFYLKEKIKVDTNKILDIYYKDFLAVKYYVDTMSDDTLTAIVEEVVCENELKSKKLTYNIKYKPVIQKNTTNIYNDGLYFGITGSYQNKLGVGLNSGYQFKSGYYIGVSYVTYDFAAPELNTININLSKKINLRN